MFLLILYIGLTVCDNIGLFVNYYNSPRLCYCDITSKAITVYDCFWSNPSSPTASYLVSNFLMRDNDNYLIPIDLHGNVKIYNVSTHDVTVINIINFSYNIIYDNPLGLIGVTYIKNKGIFVLQNLLTNNIYISFNDSQPVINGYDYYNGWYYVIVNSMIARIQPNNSNSFEPLYFTDNTSQMKYDPERNCLWLLQVYDLGQVYLGMYNMSSIQYEKKFNLPENPNFSYSMTLVDNYLYFSAYYDPTNYAVLCYDIVNNDLKLVESTFENMLYGVYS